LSDFAAGDAEVKMSGASRGRLRVSGRLDAALSGASRLRVGGEAQMGRLSISGGARLEPMTP
jgi:hypothetical protein